MRSSHIVTAYKSRLSHSLRYPMPVSRSTRQCRFNQCCCNPFVVCSSMLGLRRSPLCRSSLGPHILHTNLTIITARKPSSSSNTATPQNKNIDEGTSSNAMANDTPAAPAVNGSQNSNNANIDKPAVIAKEPKVSSSMVYEPVRKSNGLSNGTTNRASDSMTQRKKLHFFKSFIFVADSISLHRLSHPYKYLQRLGRI